MTVREWLERAGKDTEKVKNELGPEFLEATISFRIKVGNNEYRPGKFIAKLAKVIPISPEESERFVRLAVSAGYEFGVAYGVKVFEVYGDRHIESCMTGSNAVGFYAINHEVVGVAYLARNGRYYARALLWLNQYYDRVYGADRSAREYLTEQLKARGFKPVSPDLKVKMRRHHSYPYLDTLYYAYATEDSSDILLTGRNFSDGIYYEDKTWKLWAALRTVDGYYIEFDRVDYRCSVCGSSPVVERDHNGMLYCDTHARNLVWVYLDGELVRLPRQHNWVLLDNGAYATSSKEAIRLMTGELVHISQVDYTPVLVSVGSYRGHHLPKELVVMTNSGYAYFRDVVNGEVPEFLNHVHRINTLTSRVVNPEF